MRAPVPFAWKIGSEARPTPAAASTLHVAATTTAHVTASAPHVVAPTTAHVTAAASTVASATLAPMVALTVVTPVSAVTPAVMTPAVPPVPVAPTAPVVASVAAEVVAPVAVPVMSPVDILQLGVGRAGGYRCRTREVGRRSAVREERKASQDEGGRNKPKFSHLCTFELDVATPGCRVLRRMA